MSLFILLCNLCNSFSQLTDDLFSCYRFECHGKTDCEVHNPFYANTHALDFPLKSLKRQFTSFIHSRNALKLLFLHNELSKILFSNNLIK